MNWLSKLFPRRSAVNTPAPSIDRIAELTAQGRQWLDKGQAAQAVTAFRAALALQPERVDAQINLGFALLEAGDLEAAREHLQAAQAADPDNFDAQFLLAQIAYAEGDTAKAEQQAIKALALQPESPPARGLLFGLYVAQGRIDTLEQQVRALTGADARPAEVHAAVAAALAKASTAATERAPLLELALAHLDLALTSDPDMMGCWLDKGLLLNVRQESQAALKCFEQVIRLAPGHPRGHYFAGEAEIQLNRLPEALRHFEAALRLDANDIDALKAAGKVNYTLGEFEKAEAYYRKCSNLDSNSIDSLMMLAAALSEQDRYAEAMRYSDRTLQMRPDHPEVHFARGNILNAAADYKAALICYQKALELRPNFSGAKNNLGSVLLSLGRNSEALEQYIANSLAEPQNLVALSNVCYAASIEPHISSSDYLRHVRAFGTAATALVPAPYHHAPRRLASAHCLKVGMVSADFCMHPVGLFLERVISLLNTNEIELHAFSNRTRADPLQASLQQRFASWTSIVGLSDEKAAKLIHAAQLDLLIDLSGHTHLNRLSLFAWRPAPVQLSWLGYWASTGLAEMDYLLTDIYSVPTEHSSHLTERVWYLPDTRLCFSPPSAVYELQPLRNGSFSSRALTFGCYQGLRKISKEVLAAWGRILQQCPDARLRLQSSGFGTAALRETLLSQLDSVGISAHRVELHDVMSRLDYLKSYAEVDILLDTFPYPGGTTTCDALWMGVPTVTMPGLSMLSRQGASMLMCAGLHDWIASDVDQYVAIAVHQAQHPDGLQPLRKQLRQRVLDSPLFNAPLFAKHLETALRAMVEEKLAKLQVT